MFKYVGTGRAMSGSSLLNNSTFAGLDAPLKNASTVFVAVPPDAFWTKFCIVNISLVNFV